MMTPLRLVKNAPGNDARAIVRELLRLLAPTNFDAIDQKIYLIRETYRCPYTVPDYEAFNDTLFDYFRHYHRGYYGADITTDPAGAVWKNLAYDMVRQHLKGDLRTWERNAITGREGGMVAAIDAFTEGLLKLHRENYIRGVFMDNIGASDIYTRLQLAEELLAMFGKYLLPNDELLPAYFWVNNFEALMQGFATHLHEIRREWRY
jgi:hypothetical protein